MKTVFDYPPVQEEELYFSYVLRYHQFCGTKPIAHSFQEFLEIPNWNSNVAFMGHVDRSIWKIGLDGDDYIEKHSVIPFYRIFLPKIKYERMKKLIIHNSSSSYINKLHHTYYKEDSLLNRDLKYCPICHREKKSYSDIQKHHQIPWVHVCEIHHCYLNKISSLQKKKLDCPEEWDVSVQVCEETWLFGIAEDVKFILKEKPNIYVEDILAGIWKKIEQLQETQTLEEIRSKLWEHYGTLPKVYQCYAKRFELGKFFQRPIDLSILQMEYMILIRILFGSFEGFVKKLKDS